MTQENLDTPAPDNDFLRQQTDGDKKLTQDLDVLNNRMQEEIGKMRLIGIRCDELDGKIDEIDEIDDEYTLGLFDEVSGVYEEIGRAGANTDWILALQEANVPADMILKAWDLKDERARKNKEELLKSLDQED